MAQEARAVGQNVNRPASRQENGEQGKEAQSCVGRPSEDAAPVAHRQLSLRRLVPGAHGPQRWGQESPPAKASRCRLHVLEGSTRQGR